MLDVSPAFKDYILKLVSDEEPINLITMFVDDVTVEENIHRRICDYSTEVVSRGNTFIPSNMKVKPPRGTLARGRSDGSFVLDNIDRESVVWMRQNTKAPKILLETVLASSLDVVELGPYVFKFNRTSYEEKNLRIPLIQDELFTKPFQEVQFDPTRTPALYA